MVFHYKIKVFAISQVGKSFLQLTWPGGWGGVGEGFVLLLVSRTCDRMSILHALRPVASADYI